MKTEQVKLLSMKEILSNWKIAATDLLGMACGAGAVVASSGVAVALVSNIVNPPLGYAAPDYAAWGATCVFLLAAAAVGVGIVRASRRNASLLIGENRKAAGLHL